MSRSKKVKKEIIRAVIFILVLVIILLGLAKIFVPESKHSTIISEFYNEPKNTLDVIFVGESSVYKGVSPMRIWEKYKITSYDYGSPTAKLYNNYYCIKEALKYQKPKVIVLNTDQLFHNEQMKEEYKRLLYDAMKLNKNKVEAIMDPVQNNSRNEQISFIFPILRYHSRWMELEDEDFSKNKGKYDNIFKGYWLVKEIEPYKGEKYNKYQEISRNELKYFEKIADLCKENSIELIAVEFPSIQTWNNSKKEKVEQIAKDNNVRFLDLHDVLDEIGIDWCKDTGDEGYHLNISGTEKISDYLGKFLSDNYEFENYKKEEVYKNWEEELIKYNEYKNK